MLDNSTELALVDAINHGTNNLAGVGYLGIVLASISSMLPLIIIFYGDTIMFKLMGFTKIGKLLKGLNKRTGQGVILFSTDVDFKSMDKMESALNKFQKKGIKDIILIITTGGGYGFCMERIAGAIRNFNGNVHAYVPRYSMSAGSMIALNCKDIHMNENSSIGAVDGQMGVLFWVYPQAAWQKVAKMKGKKADDQTLLMAHLAEQYGKMGKDYLDKVPSLAGNNKFKDFITNGKIPHAQQLDKKMLQSFGLTVLPIEYHEVNDIADLNPRGLYVVGL